ncbi:GNAT family N-acetyltransferase [Cohnella terricola]|uniref:GNAT family N-acetyltransferase n=1 Tax=Cohnella terricola TaxID=1289167 RepID=A0A559J696_9BACL|nr:GNAT family N-acetyltransferase [Cohnella terricola]
MQDDYVTHRLILRTLGEDGASQVLDYVTRNKEFLQPWEPLRSPDFYSLDAQREMLRFDRECIDQGILFKVWISKQSDPERIIGSVSLSNIVRGVFLSCHVGYKLDARELNKGYMSEALEKVAGIAFQQLGLHRLEANIMPRNAASLRIAEKAGFQPEGLAKKYLKINGKWEDHIHMTLLNEDME